MTVNKVIYDGTTLVDLTSDTVTADNLASGVTATAANGEKITGLLPKVTIDTALSETSTNPVTNAAITTAVNAKADTSSLSAVATSGAYSDLSGVPTNHATYDTATVGSVENPVYLNNGVITACDIMTADELRAILDE